MEPMPTNAQTNKKPFSHVVNIRVPEALYQRILRVVEDEGITLADWTRDALLNAVRRAERHSARLDNP